MEKRLLDYMAYLKAISEKAEKNEFTPEELEVLRQQASLQIAFFQHERLIHLIVTMTFALMTMITLAGICITGYLPLTALMVLLLVLLVPYIRHYYILENGTQTLYRYYDSLESERTPKGLKPFEQRKKD
ncbi:MAG: hypothetical protein J6W85_11045 [Lachnospiraceae bacterium]|nr:hypothetical protein [Lachnospiraceae bacterium]MBP5702970.1 hypothetical protein [Lachnospiraceae bacterium]MBP5762701.1 hypothetical protein [Lachnospiraceae bacterium]